MIPVREIELFGRPMRHCWFNDKNMSESARWSGTSSRCKPRSDPELRDNSNNEKTATPRLTYVLTLSYLRLRGYSTAKAGRPDPTSGFMTVYQ